jgi:hypothetical protein
MPQSVELEDQEWQQVLGLISEGPWRAANPLLMKIGAQLQAQQLRRSDTTAPIVINKQTNADGKEADHG